MIPDPKHFRTLLDSAEGKEFAKYLASLILSLDSIGGINLDDPDEATIEMKARMRAKEKLETALAVLLTGENHGIVKDERDDYSMDVDGINKK